jgi:hypothetical protein
LTFDQKQPKKYKWFMSSYDICEQSFQFLQTQKQKKIVQCWAKFSLNVCWKTVIRPLFLWFSKLQSNFGVSNCFQFTSVLQQDYSANTLYKELQQQQSHSFSSTHSHKSISLILHIAPGQVQLNRTHSLSLSLYFRKVAVREIDYAVKSRRQNFRWESTQSQSPSKFPSKLTSVSVKTSVREARSTQLYNQPTLQGHISTICKDR